MSEKTYTTTVGLEIHAELKTVTKMFCHSKNDPDETRPNANICPICMGHPGTLPVINKKAVEQVLRVGLALKGTLADFTEFDRKNYFYPDIPKGYQLSQYKYPLVSGGELAGVKITRVHLEEDTATSIHDQGDHSLIDFNRAGVPLMELVTEPVIHSAKEAGDFARELQLLLQYLGASDANMEKGEMRVEANISVSDNPEKLGTKVEVKNINSFRAVEKAIAYETARHIALLSKGERVVQETRGWDEHKEITFSQRLKEDSHDYRYFPDPDLPKLKLSLVSEFSHDRLQKSLPELPSEKRARYQTQFGLKPIDTEVFVVNKPLADFFESVSGLLSSPEAIKLASNYLVSDFLGIAKKDTAHNAIGHALLRITPTYFAELILLISTGELSSRGAKDTLAEMYISGGSPKSIADSKGLIQKNDLEHLEKIAEEIVGEHTAAVAEYHAGKEASIQFLVGQGMKKSSGSANPKLLREAILRVIKK
ncbi:MAG: Asp-tRNA(Asn)/Glu-tRNA(Gln) amidotransferase subunit GatB [Patescibacteria group bacterium]